MPTKIEWSDDTWNPVGGCTHASPGCDHCYAEKMARRLKGMGHPVYVDVVGETGWNGNMSIAPPGHKVWTQLKRWKKPRKVFVGSMCDLFHENRTMQGMRKVFVACERAPQHTYFFLTKRPKMMAEAIRDWRVDHEAAYGYRGHTKHGIPDNWWFGVSVENISCLDRTGVLCRIPDINRWISFEPLLEDVIGMFRPIERARWMVVGCETGNNRRPCAISTVETIVSGAKELNIPVFVKALEINGKVSKNPAEWPEHLRLREWPKGVA